MARNVWTSGLLVAGLIATGAAHAQETRPDLDRNGNQRSRVSGDSQPSIADDKQFVRDMSIANLAEVQLGRLALQRATNPDVKSFAQMMVTEHEQSNRDLAPIARTLGVEQPRRIDAKHETMVNRLSKLRGAEFDREFMKTMVASHQDAVMQVRSMASKDPTGTPPANQPPAIGTAGSSGMRDCATRRSDIGTCDRFAALQWHFGSGN